MIDDLLDPRYLLGLLRRRWLLILAPIAVGAPLALLVAYVLPPVFQSSGRILIVSQQIPQELAASTVATGPEERISQLEQRLTTRSNLLELARRHDVFRGYGDLSPTEIVNRMRAATEIQSVSFTSDPRGAESVNAVEIAFNASRPQVAAQVANEFITQLLAQNARQRTELAAGTVEFFDSQVESLAQDLAALEARIADFRRENELSLPESLAFRRETLASLQREDYVQESRRLALEERRRGLEEAAALGLQAGDGPLTPQERELQNLRTALAQQSAVFSQTHPSIRALTARIAALEAVVEGATLSDAGPEAEAGARRSRVEDDIERIEAEIALIDEQRAADQERMALLEAAIDRAPEVDVALSALARNYSALKAQYEQAVMRRAAAATGERLEVTNQAERLEILEQPQIPERPVSPNRPLIAGLGGVASLFLGLGLAVLVELLNPVLRTSRDLERRLDLRPIVSIPYIPVEAEIRSRRRVVRSAAFIVLVAIPAALFALDQYVLPLPLVFERTAEAIGLDDAINLFQRRFGG